MKTRILLSAVMAMAVIVLNGCAPPPDVANSNGASGNSARGGARTDSTGDDEPPRMEPPADNPTFKNSQPEADNRIEDDPSPSMDRTPSDSNLEGRDSNSDPATTEPTAKKEFKFEFVSVTGEIGLEPGDTIPNIEGQDLDGIEFQLSDYQGKVIMIDFWGDW